MSDKPQDARRIDNTSDVATTPTVKVTMQQAYDLNVTVSFVPARDIPTRLTRACQSRQGAQRVDKDPLELPEPTRKWLLEVNKAVIAWLARDEKNQRAFLADPVAAVQSAGIPIERSHLKALARARDSAGLAEAVAPGLQLRSIRTQANKSGSVKQGSTSGSEWRPPKLEDGAEHCDEDDKEGRS